jgi:hypothetical protein
MPGSLLWDSIDLVTRVVSWNVSGDEVSLWGVIVRAGVSWFG